MDLTTLEKIGPLADRLTAFALAITVLVGLVFSGAKGVWVFGATARERLKEKDAEIAKLESKLNAQERLIDRLSGLAERSTELARHDVVQDIQEHRATRHRFARDA